MDRGLLAGPILKGGYDFVAPLYARYKYDGTIDEHRDLPADPRPLRPPDPAAHRRRLARALWLGPDEWLIVDADGTSDAVVARPRCIRGWAGAVVDVSANRTTLRLAGSGAREILETGCSIDLHPRAFGPGRCAQTTVARTSAILLEVEPGADAAGGPDYRLLVRPSFASYLASWLLDAVDGLADDAILAT